MFEIGQRINHLNNGDNGTIVGPGAEVDSTDMIHRQVQWDHTKGLTNVVVFRNNKSLVGIGEKVVTLQPLAKKLKAPREHKGMSKDTLEGVVIRTLLAYPGFKDEIETREQLTKWMEENRGSSTIKTFDHCSWSGTLSNLQTNGIAESRGGDWFLVNDWEAKRALRDAKAKALEDERIEMFGAFAPLLRALTKPLEIKAINTEIENLSRDEEGDLSAELRETNTRRLALEKWGTHAWFTGETDPGAVQASHIIDVSLFAAAHVGSADNTPWNVHPTSPNLNVWERMNLVKMVPTPTGVKLQVLCSDPEILKYNGREETIENKFDREQVHTRIELRNQLARVI